MILWARRSGLPGARRSAGRCRSERSSCVTDRSLGQALTGVKPGKMRSRTPSLRRLTRPAAGWRLHRCELYVTLEPCPMCAGAIINARIRRLVFGARDPKSGCFGSVSDFNALAFNHKPQVVCGVRGEECAQILSAFFQKLRRGRQ